MFLRVIYLLRAGRRATCYKSYKRYKAFCNAETPLFIAFEGVVTDVTEKTLYPRPERVQKII